MSNSFSIFSKLILACFLFVFIICILFIPILTTNYFDLGYSNMSDFFIMSDEEYLWPVPGFTYITSPFGNRYSPTSGASSYHSGIDIGAPQGAKLYAITSGQITFTGFLGGGGYTITLTSNDMKFTYCHVSPNYIVQEGDYVQKGQLIRLCRS